MKGIRQRRLHKAFLRYHDAENWPLLREALKEMGRADLIGPGKHQLIPTWQPAGTGLTGGEGKRMGVKKGEQVFLTKGADRPMNPRGPTHLAAAARDADRPSTAPSASPRPSASSRPSGWARPKPKGPGKRG